MDKNEANKRLAAIESEAEALRAIINAPEQQKPKPGEVWQHKFDTGRFLYTEDAEHVELPSDDIPSSQVELFSNDDFPSHAGIRLGTFDEVYVERSKIEAIIKEVLDEEDAWTDVGGRLYSRAAVKARNQLKSLL